MDRAVRYATKRDRESGLYRGLKPTIDSVVVCGEKPYAPEPLACRPFSPRPTASFDEDRRSALVEIGHFAGVAAAAASAEAVGLPPALLAAVEMSNEPAVSAVGVTAERDGWGQLIVAVWRCPHRRIFLDGPLEAVASTG